MAQTKNLPELSAWRVGTMRLTAFPSPLARFSEPSWWADLMGTPSESRKSRPQRGEHQEEGPLEPGKLILQTNPIRIDWLFIPKLDSDNEAPLTIGTYSSAFDSFSKLMLRWLTPPMCPPLQRLAFGAVLLQSVDGREAGYKLLSEYLHALKIDPEGSSDLLYQINRARQSTSGVTNLKVNRLSKWSVSSTQLIGIPVGQIPVGKVLGPEDFACHLELDINTDKDYPSELPKEQLPVIFQELAGLAKEIASKGDIP